MERTKQKTFSDKQRKKAFKSHLNTSRRLTKKSATAEPRHSHSPALLLHSSSSSSSLKETTDIVILAPPVSKNGEPIDPKKLNSNQRLVRFYKNLRGVGKDNAEWDKANWPKYAPQAKDFLEYFNNGNTEPEIMQAMNCLNDIYKDMTSRKDKETGKHLELSIAGAIKHIAEWRVKNVNQAIES